MKPINKERIFQIRLNERQLSLLREKANDYGFTSMSEYIRFQLFLSMSPIEKLDKIYRKICEQNG